MIKRNRFKYVTPSQIPKSLYCPICQSIFVIPLRLDCGHVYCKDCLAGWAKNRTDCPMDRNPIGKSIDRLKEDPLCKAILDEFQIYCTNSYNGCRAVLKRDELDTHLKSCEFEEDEIGYLGDNRTECEDADELLNEILMKEDIYSNLSMKLGKKIEVSKPEDKKIRNSLEKRMDAYYEALKEENKDKAVERLLQMTLTEAEEEKQVVEKNGHKFRQKYVNGQKYLLFIEEKNKKGKRLKRNRRKLKRTGCGDLGTSGWHQRNPRST